jgi:hypothetical protein
MSNDNLKNTAQQAMETDIEVPSWTCSIDQEMVDVHVIRVSHFNVSAKLGWLLSEVEKAPGVSEAMNSDGFTGLYFKRTPETETSALFLFGSARWAADFISPYLQHYDADEGAYKCRAIPFTLRLSTVENKSLGPLIWIKTPGEAKDSRNLTIISRDNLKTTEMLSWLRKNDDTRYVMMTCKESGEYAVFRVGFYSDRAGLLFRRHVDSPDLHCERAVHPRFTNLVLYTMPTETVSDLSAGMMRRRQMAQRPRLSDTSTPRRDRNEDRRLEDRVASRMNCSSGRSGRGNPPRQSRHVEAGRARTGVGHQQRWDQRPRK